MGRDLWVEERSLWEKALLHRGACVVDDITGG